MRWIVAAFAVFAAACCLPRLAATEPAAPRPIVVLTFNTGTTLRLKHDATRTDGYGAAEAALSDRWYGNGLAWRPAIEAVEKMIRVVDPDVVAFQEIFDCRRCKGIPEEARRGFACEEWSAGDPDVAQQVLGSDYQIGYHPVKTNKCLAVHRRLGRFRGTKPGDVTCTLEGAPVAGCGSGARVARGVVDCCDGQTLTIISLHGTSGFKPADQQCRLRQVERIFVDWGDGQPGVSRQNNVILGDFNTDPGRATAVDRSAARWNDFVGPGKSFHYVSQIGSDVLPSYGGLADIDHVVSDTYVGACRRLGVDPGTRRVYKGVYFDHVPVVCTLTPRRGDSVPSPDGASRKK